MPDEWENAFEWMEGQKVVTVTLHSQKLKNRVLKLAEQNPGKVRIIARPDDRGQNGYLLAHVPASWIRIDPPRKVNLTDERKEELRERLAAMRTGRKS